MGKHTIVFVFLALIVVLVIIPTTGNAEEWRAIAMDGWHNGMWSQSECNQTFTDAGTGHYNVIVAQMRKKGDALYVSHYGGPSGTGEPMYSGVQSGFDPLQYICDQAHARGMKVYAWVCTHRCPTTAGTTPEDWFYNSHNNWLTKDHTGALINSEGWWLDPGVPDGEDYTVKVIVDMVKNYPVDGVQFDRIRYPGSDSGFNTIAQNRFHAEFGYWPAYTDATFSDWRRRQLNDFEARCYAQIQEARPGTAVAVDSWADYTAGKGTYFQDEAAWFANHTLDVDNLMNYTGSNSTFNSNLTTHLNNRNGRYVWSGHNIDASYNTQGNSCNQINNARALNDSKNCPEGTQTYDYYYATTSGHSLGWFTYVTASSSRPFYYTDTVPSMPWKTAPTNGIILGQVTDASHPNDATYHDWIYNATVTLYQAGPPIINRTTQTDSTGYFVFTDVDPKVQTSGYTLSISKAGFPTRSFTGQAIAAGQVLRLDAELGTRTVSSPSSAVNRRGKALFSLPLEPVNPDPAALLAGITIDYKLTRWDRPGQGSTTYDESDPDHFGILSLDQGYWLAVDAPYTISYLANGSTLASRSQSLPKHGWNIIGCPYEAEHAWEDQTITSGTTTMSLQAAKDTGLINSVGIWWDSVGQGSRDIGLPDDAAYTDQLQPWHGVWFKTYADNLTLTQH